MRWQTGRRSTNVEDRRGMRPAVMGGGIGAVVLTLIALLLGVNPGDIIQGDPGTQPGTVPQPGGPLPDDEQSQFIAVVLADTEDTWNALFARSGEDYQEPTLVLFDGVVQSACGFAQAAVGPFYCPDDHRLYIDLSFYRDLRERLGAPGDFAQAYVIAHEVGHHVQTLLGLSQEIASARQRASQAEANALSVRLELQADCLAGIWAHHADRTRGVVEQGDIEEALNAAAAIGDDRLQRQSQGYVAPESFTHGSSEQRQRWFKRGFDSGDVNRCDTFQAAEI
jgi:predicted metalloprotease